MNLAQRILRFCHPKAEEERMQLREELARAQAEAEEVARTTTIDAERLKKWLAENCNGCGSKNK